MEEGKARKVLNLAQCARELLATPWSQGPVPWQEEIPAAEAGGGEGTLALSWVLQGNLNLCHKMPA